MQADELTALPYKQAGQGGCRQMSSQHCPVHNVHAGAAASIQPASQLHSPSLPTCAPSPRSIPVSTSHICVFAAVAVGLFEGRKGVNWWMVLQTICAVSARPERSPENLEMEWSADAATQWLLDQGM